MSPRDSARATGAARIALGASLLLWPQHTARGWIGSDARRPRTIVMSRAVGIREVVLGTVAMSIADEPRLGPRYLCLLALCDSVDLAATIAARRSLPRALFFTGLLAGVNVADNLWIARELAAAHRPGSGD